MSKSSMSKSSVSKTQAERRAGERGSYMIENSLVFLVFLLLLFGIMEFGRAVAAYNVLASATREGTRYAIVHGSRSGSPATATDIQTQVRNWCIGFDPSGVTVTTTWPGGNAPGQPVNVTTRYTFVPVVAFLGNLTMGSSSQMVISQ